MSDQPQPPEQRLVVEIAAEVEPGIYADAVNLWHTGDIFTLDFMALRAAPSLAKDPDTEQQVVVIPTRIVARVRIPPAQVFEVMKALSQQLNAWEIATGRQKPPGEGIMESEPDGS